MAEAKVVEAPKGPKGQIEFAPEIIAEDLVMRVASVRKPVLADSAKKILDLCKTKLDAGNPSDWMLVGETSDTKLRAAFKYHGYSVGFGQTKDETPRPVFRVIGRYESREDKRKREAAEAAAKENAGNAA